MSEPRITAPEGGAKISIDGGKLQVPDNPIIPFIEGDGTGPRHLACLGARVRCRGRAGVLAARRRFDWKPEMLRRPEAAFDKTGDLAARRDRRCRSREHLIGYQGSADHAGRCRGFDDAQPQRRAPPDPRSLHLPAAGALLPGRAVVRCKSAGATTDMVIFRENTEDIYAGIEFQDGTDDCDQKFKALLQEKHSPTAMPEGALPRVTTGFGIKPISVRGHRAPGARGDRVRDCKNERKTP